jgi:hypothetical protein
MTGQPYQNFQRPMTFILKWRGFTPFDVSSAWCPSRTITACRIAPESRANLP